MLAKSSGTLITISGMQPGIVVICGRTTEIFDVTQGICTATARMRGRTTEISGRTAEIFIVIGVAVDIKRFLNTGPGNPGLFCPVKRAQSARM